MIRDLVRDPVRDPVHDLVSGPIRSDLVLLTPTIILVTQTKFGLRKDSVDITVQVLGLMPVDLHAQLQIPKFFI